ncbi:hypothetical protein ABTZ17_33640, partial [Streptomyces sp. NPDC097619]
MIVSGGVVVPLVTSSTAHAADPLGWNRPASVGGDEHNPRAEDMELGALSDGSAVAAWREAGNLTVKVRPVADDFWTGPTFTATGLTSRLPLRITAGQGGGATITWAESADVGWGKPLPATRLMTSELRSGVWSEPRELLAAGAGLAVDSFQVAAGPQGTAVAVWSGARTDGSGSAVYTASRGADGSWSPASRVVGSEPEGTRLVDGADVAVTPAGDALIAYRATGTDGLPGIVTTERPGTGGDWSTPTPAVAPAKGLRAPNAGAGHDGSLALTWSESRDWGQGEWDPTSRFGVTGKRPGGAWKTPTHVTSEAFDSVVPAPEPLIAPDGDITLVWHESYENDSEAPNADSAVISSTLAAGSGSWVRKRLNVPNSGYGFDASIAPDGTLRVAWREWRGTPETGGRFAVVATRTSTNDTWTAPRAMPHDLFDGPSGEYPQVAAGPNGSATVLWNSSMAGPLSSRTGYRPAPAIVSSTVPATAALAGTTAGSKVWKPVWKPKEAVDSWRLTLTDRSGKLFRTLSSSTNVASFATIAPQWNGRDASNGTVPAANGPLTWRLYAKGKQAGEETALGSGTVTVTGGAAVRRDLGSRTGTPDGTGD